MSRVLLVGINYAPEQVGIGPYSHGLAQALKARGSSIEVITAKPYYPQWRTQPGFARGWQCREEDGIRVHRCPIYVPDQPSGLKRIAHLLSFALSALPVALRCALARRTDRPDLVIAVAPALLSVMTAWIAARICGARLWIHVQDFEVEAALATGLMGQAGPAARLARRIEAVLLRLGDFVSTISAQMCARLVSKGIDPQRVFEMRNWADARFAPDPQGAKQLRAKWGLGERTVALYSGNIALKQGIEILVEAARHLRARGDIVLVICGEGPNRVALEDRAAGLENVQLHDLQSAERMGAMLTMADLHLLPQIAGAADLVLPSKLTNMLASGRPVIATTLPGTGLYDEVDGCGSLVVPGDAAALAKAIAELADDPQRRETLGRAAARRAGERWSKDAIIAGAIAALTSRA